ncbi:MAG: phytoene/squalene synthase family protein [Saprospiraceae bacterium]|nr:phytoene/squalene synthase family protein [Saprospiraceae bacterium]
MMSLYSKTCADCSKLITNYYSTSFSLGIKMFASELRSPIYSIYGFVRFADEIVDTFHDKDKRGLLEEFNQDTFKALERGISTNPVLHTFQEVVHQYNIEYAHIEAFLKSMEMDLVDIEYDEATLKEYIYGSAEVIGLMCLKVFCNGNESQYKELEPYAISLGSAFQKINFLRDMKSDFEERGRVYFPGVDLSNFTQEDKLRIEDDIQKEFDHALIGIQRLPRGAKLGVYTAYRYYISLFYKIKEAQASNILSKRIRINNGKKMYLLTASAVKNKFGLL